MKKLEWHTEKRKIADRISNINDAPKKPDWATGTGTENMAPGTSIFDPVLCEVIYTWFNIKEGSILDPFAGGSVRGIVAKYLGYQYTGIDLRKEQIEANRIQEKEIFDTNDINWIIGNSLDLDKLVNQQFDLIFSCPPYFDLEIYSDDKNDLSNLTWDSFLIQYNQIIDKALNKLKNNRFACFVVSDIRDKQGYYRNFVSETIKAFIKNNDVHLYNEIILVNVAGSLPIRVSKAFSSNRKVGKMHQNILVFLKGNAKTIKANYPQIDIPIINNDIES